jgi:hypothetical protein
MNVSEELEKFDHVGEAIALGELGLILRIELAPVYIYLSPLDPDLLHLDALLVGEELLTGWRSHSAVELKHRARRRVAMRTNLPDGLALPAVLDESREARAKIVGGHGTLWI